MNDPSIMHQTHKKMPKVSLRHFIWMILLIEIKAFVEPVEYMFRHIDGF